jgi:chorismate mutase
MLVRGIRGATTVTENEAEQIREATRELFTSVCQANELQADDLASVFITVTADLSAVFPATAIRTVPGFEDVPLMCAVEMDVPGALPRCIRLLLHANTMASPRDVQHVFLREAVSLRPDLANRRK